MIVPDDTSIEGSTSIAREPKAANEFPLEDAEQLTEAKLRFHKPMQRLGWPLKTKTMMENQRGAAPNKRPKQ